jgi:2-phospho-L-lactate/phosphoenolpyruvate guanylyltransferase
MNSGICAVIPVREFRATKVRLKEVLSDDQRASLTASLLSRVVNCLGHSRVDSIVIVATDPDEVWSRVARDEIVSVIPESIRHGGVNSAMRDGMRIASNNGFAKAMLLPSDLPLIDSQSVDFALELLGSHDLIICPSLKKDGTNVLGLDSSSRFQLHYDDDSYSKHCQEARLLGLEFVSFENPELCTDLDDRSDLEIVRIKYKSISFDDLLDDISMKSKTWKEKKEWVAR